MEKRKVIVRIIVCFLAVMSFICLLTSEAEAKRQKQGSALSQYLDRQIETSDANQLIEVAKCKYATKKQLVEVSKRCASYDDYDDKIEAIELAKVLIKNKKSTGKVTEQLANSEFSEIRLMVAKSNKSNEETLKSLAKLCASYDDYDDKIEAIELAQALVRNKKSTGKVINELANSEFCEVVSIGHQWVDKKAKRNEKIQYLDRQIQTSDADQLIEVAKCKYATRKQLAEVAKRCASYDDYDDKKEAIELAQALVKNKKSTGEVINELANSCFREVVSIGHKALEKKVKKAKNKR